MIIAHNGASWQPTLHQAQRANDEQAVAQATDFRTAITTASTTAQQQNQGNTAQQNAEDAQEEAFAKHKVMLQNLGSGVFGQDSTEQLTTSTARQAFQDLMSKSHGEMIKEKLLREIGLTKEEYDALPPETRAKVDEWIAQRMTEEIKRKTQEKAEEQTAKVNGTADEDEQSVSQV
ncbi:hypothetical protein [Pseudomonas monteilii]|uniref:Uncharacterized protein n=1 Tax=Pseudomonas monteilii TaxID=76759 RepID=A0A399MA62_9PSED|nr:hypothetical protein [Pseudomonas monteilii]RII78698.1 hypothetical protein D0894_06945 [Pseudomonas monteilii]